MAIELQRRVTANGAHFVGGMAVLTRVTAQGISQTIAKRWEADAIGQTIQAEPIDWQAWRNARQLSNIAGLQIDGLSRLQRQRMDKKLRKRTLR